MPEQMVEIEGDLLTIILSAGGTMQLNNVRFAGPEFVPAYLADLYQLQTMAGEVIGQIVLARNGPGYHQLTNAIQTYQRLTHA